MSCTRQTTILLHWPKNRYHNYFVDSAFLYNTVDNMPYEFKKTIENT